MYYYRIYGMRVASDIRIGEAYEITPDGAAADITMRRTDLGEMREMLDASRTPQGEDEQRYNLVARFDRGQSVLYYLEIGVFRISGGSLIEYMPIMDDQSPLFRQWLLCMALAAARIQREEITIHGSGLMMPETEAAFIISGDSGSGKSTLADVLLGAGCRFLADDAVALNDTPDGIMAEGAYPTRRLCADVVEARHMDKSQLCYIHDGSREKYILDMSDSYYGAVPRPLRAMFVIVPSRECTRVAAREITGGDKLKVLMHNLYKRSTYRKMGITPQIFSRCMRVAQTVPVYELQRPVGQQTADALAGLVTELMQRI